MCHKMSVSGWEPAKISVVLSESAQAGMQFVGSLPKENECNLQPAKLVLPRRAKGLAGLPAAV